MSPFPEKPMLELAEKIDLCAAITLVGGDGTKEFLPVASRKLISAALRALARARAAPEGKGGAGRGDYHDGERSE